MAALCLAACSAAPALGATLSLLADAGPGSVKPGDFVVVHVRMSSLGAESAAGFQAFLHFDSSRLAFVSGSYTSTPFGLPIISPIRADGEDIDIASGISVFTGQAPTSADATLALLVFQSLTGGCVTSVSFRVHDPPTKLTELGGAPIIPALLIDLPDEAPSPDLNDSGQVNGIDLGMLLAQWGPCPPLGPCSADLNCDGVVNGLDLAMLLAAWG